MSVTAGVQRHKVLRRRRTILDLAKNPVNALRLSVLSDLGIASVAFAIWPEEAVNTGIRDNHRIEISARLPME
ncbi:hypothetical protein ATY75_12145 [Rhizobium sp. N122]|nr:hypothetical protein ATY75_12145 [Rhizobium sp. N122]